MMCCVHNWEQHVLLLLMTTQPGTFCLSPYAHMRAAACCLHITAAPIVRKHASCFVSSCAVTARGLLVRADLHPLMHVHRVPGDLVARFVHLSKPATSVASPRGCCCTQATASRAGGLAAGLLLHASHGLARRLAALGMRVLNVESTVETHGTQLGDACFMSEHNAKVPRNVHARAPGAVRTAARKRHLRRRRGAPAAARGAAHLGDAAVPVLAAL